MHLRNFCMHNAARDSTCGSQLERLHSPLDFGEEEVRGTPEKYAREEDVTNDIIRCVQNTQLMYCCESKSKIGLKIGLKASVEGAEDTSDDEEWREADSNATPLEVELNDLTPQ